MLTYQKPLAIGIGRLFSKPLCITRHNVFHFATIDTGVVCVCCGHSPNTAIDMVCFPSGVACLFLQSNPYFVVNIKLTQVTRRFVYVSKPFGWVCLPLALMMRKHTNLCRVVHTLFATHSSGRIHSTDAGNDKEGGHIK